MIWNSNFLFQPSKIRKHPINKKLVIFFFTLRLTPRVNRRPSKIIISNFPNCPGRGPRVILRGVFEQTSRSKLIHTHNIKEPSNSWLKRGRPSPPQNTRNTSSGYTWWLLLLQILTLRKIIFSRTCHPAAVSCCLKNKLRNLLISYSAKFFLSFHFLKGFSFLFYWPRFEVDSYIVGCFL